MSEGEKQSAYPFTLEDLQERVDRLVKRLRHGCGNHGCRIHPPSGMGTNMACRCSPQRIAEDLLQLAALTEAMGRDWRHTPS